MLSAGSALARTCLQTPRVPPTVGITGSPVMLCAKRSLISWLVRALHAFSSRSLIGCIVQQAGQGPAGGRVRTCRAGPGQLGHLGHHGAQGAVRPPCSSAKSAVPHPAAADGSTCKCGSTCPRMRALLAHRSPRTWAVAPCASAPAAPLLLRGDMPFTFSLASSATILCCRRGCGTGAGGVRCARRVFTARGEGLRRGVFNR